MGRTYVRTYVRGTICTVVAPGGGILLIIGGIPVFNRVTARAYTVALPLALAESNEFS